MTTNIFHAAGVGHGITRVYITIPNPPAVLPNNCDAFASICEWDAGHGVAVSGAAQMSVLSVIVGTGVVEVTINIQWPKDLGYRISLLVCTV
jgi:hypothetical protein